MAIGRQIWRPAIVEASIEAIVTRGGLEGLAVHWLPEMPPLQFRADPFGLWREGVLHIFVETYDHRTRHGAIELLRYTPDFAPIDRQIVLSEPWHLSYPFVFEAEGETWMLPEAAKSGVLTLYRAAAFPNRWKAVSRIEGVGAAIDATPFFHDGLWWLFHTLPADPMAALQIAFAERLAGPWRTHRANPVRIDWSGARPGGTACVTDGRVMLPVQDCSRTYGGAIRPLFFDLLSPDAVKTDLGAAILPPASFGPYSKGVHTLAAVGDLTLIDAKRNNRSPRAIGLQIARAFGR